jgi:hypothetical protein
VGAWGKRRQRETIRKLPRITRPAAPQPQQFGSDHNPSIDSNGSGTALSVQDYRPALPPVNVMLLALEPLRLLGATDVVPGRLAPGPWSIPAIAQGRESVKRLGLLFAGGGQMDILEMCAFIQAGCDASRCPQLEVQRPTHVWEDDVEPVSSGSQRAIAALFGVSQSCIEK